MIVTACQSRLKPKPGDVQHTNTTHMQAKRGKGGRTAKKKKHRKNTEIK